MLKYVPSITREPIHQRLSCLFRQRISQGEWTEGRALPSEAQLCTENGVSRGTVRQALASLRSEGLIAGKRGKPPVVARPVPSQPFATFMSFSEWAHSLERVPGQRTWEIARRTAGVELAAKMRIEPGAPVVQVLRLRLLDGTPIMVERSNFIAEAGDALFDFDTDSGSIFGHLSSLGIELSRGKHVIDAVGADDTDARLLGVPAGSSLLRECRLTYRAGGRILECSDDRYLPRLANFVIENTRESGAALVRVPCPDPLCHPNENNQRKAENND
ncbi:GntR family transcriptional regulator [Paeniglutamicibacter antarcticus]|uniref:GntR family transcriptional regulator n=1 Tax=Paeniglutamicibacter antarcticus TaxID=494023 RepID=A0ABP9TFC1_9MICC